VLDVRAWLVLRSDRREWSGDVPNVCRGQVLEGYPHPVRVLSAVLVVAGRQRHSDQLHVSRGIHSLDSKRRSERSSVLRMRRRKVQDSNRFGRLHGLRSKYVFGDVELVLGGRLLDMRLEHRVASG